MSGLAVDGLYFDPYLAERRVDTLPNGDLRVAGCYLARELGRTHAGMVGHQWVACFAKAAAGNVYVTKFGVGRVARDGSGLHAEYTVHPDAAAGTLTFIRADSAPVVWRLAPPPPPPLRGSGVTSDP